MHVVLFEGVREFETDLARDQDENRNLDHILKMLYTHEVFSTGSSNDRHRGMIVYP
jgi:hypothetical protein